MLADSAMRDNMLVADRALNDAAILDNSSFDTGHADAGPTDLQQSDRAVSDLSQPDSTIADTRRPDTSPTDAYVFYGPFAASNLPRPIMDADNSGSKMTMVAITVPASLNSNFVDFHVEIQHQDSRDLLVEVLPPTGSGATLYDGRSCSENCSATLVLEQRENVYNDTQGNWVLRVTDKNPGSTGTINVFTIGFAH